MRFHFRPIVVSVLLVIAGIYASHFLLDNYQRLDGVVRFSAPFALAAAAAQIAFLGMWVFAWRQVLLASGTGAKVKWIEAVSHIAAGGLAKYLPGKFWGPAARIALLRDTGESWGSSVISLFLEQYLVVHSALIVCSVAFAAIAESSESRVLAGACIATAPFGADVLRLVRGAIGRYRYIGFLRGVNGALVNFTMPRVRYSRLLFSYALVWLLNGAVMSLLFAAFFQTFGDGDMFAAILLANTAGILLGFAALFAPGGLGVREGVISLMLAPYIGGKNAVALAIVARLWNVAYELAASLVLIRLIRPRSR